MWRRKSRSSWKSGDLQNEPLGVDIAEPAVIFALQAAGLNVVDGQQLMLNSRKVKTEDEISLLNMACSLVDATYDELYRALRPGVRENEAVAMATKTLYEMGSEHVEGINAISGREVQSPSAQLHGPRY